MPRACFDATAMIAGKRHTTTICATKILWQTGNLNTVCGDGNAGAQYNLEATLPREGILLA